MSETATGKKSKYGVKRPKVPAFARYEGTSAWRKHRRRVRTYAWVQAREKAKAGQPA